MMSDNNTHDSVDFQNHGGHIHSDAYGYVDLNAFNGGDEYHSVDHLITNTGSVLIRVDGVALDDLCDTHTHHRREETGGVPAGGF